MPAMLPSDTTSPLRSASASLGLDFPPFTTAQLIATVGTGDAPASFGFLTNTPALTASIGGSGSASFGLLTNTALLGAIASFEASAAFGFDGNAIRLPTNDSPPLRSASATFDLSGALSPYAIGHMVGTTADAGVTVDNIVNGVWNAVQTNFILPGSTGYTLSLAGSGGVDYVALSTAVWTALNRTLSTPYPSSADIAAEILATPYP